MGFSTRTRMNHQSYARSLTIHGEFSPNGGSAISTQKITGGTFTRTGQGTIDFVTDVPVKDYWRPSVNLNMGTPNGSYAKVIAVSKAASGILTVTIGTFDSAHAAADIAAHATNYVDMDLKVQVVG